MRRVLVSVAAAAVLIAGAVVATSISASSASAQDDSVESIAPAQGRLEAALADLVEQGVITQDQADAVADHLRDSFSGVRPHRHPVRHGLATAAEVIGIETTDLVAQLQDGATIAQVAEANGVSAETVIDAVVAEATERLDAAVEAGRISEDEAADLATRIEERVTGFVNGEHEGRSERPGRGRFGDASGPFGGSGPGNGLAGFDA